MIHKNRGFTMLELLVACSILFMLAGLIFSAFGPAREKSRQSVCASNLHQWGLAFAMYVQDYDGVDPQIGKEYTHAQLGLPPAGDISGFLKQYKIDDSPVESCPSAHYGGKPGRKISYVLPAFLDEDVDPGYENMVSRLGPNMALVTCEMHNVSTDFSHEPSWAMKWVQSVHIDQHVQFHQVKASTSSSFE